MFKYNQLYKYFYNINFKNVNANIHSVDACIRRKLDVSWTERKRMSCTVARGRNRDGPVAQPDSAVRFGRTGWGFESLQAHFTSNTLTKTLLFLLCRFPLNFLCGFCIFSLTVLPKTFQD